MLLGFNEVTWVLKDWLRENILTSNAVSEKIELVQRSLHDYGLKKPEIETLTEKKI